ncbi:MAG TPA: ImmA/IrrE family metallo-endopeptidase [Firmicutes bacterium]|nr:ImmA/IrrE family metallo-endopeptidase [Bacillota bacterium]
MPENLLRLAEKEGILVGFFALTGDTLGVYYRVSGRPPVILLNKRIQHNRKLLRCILAEELGHHFTTSSNEMAFALTSKYLTKKYEKIALWWAVNHLIPINSLVQAMKYKIYDTRELADLFDVTERFMATGLQLYTEKYGDLINLNVPPDKNAATPPDSKNTAPKRLF